MAKKKIYGWEKLNKASCLLECELDTKKFKVIDKITGEIKIKDVCYLAYNNEAKWFTNFNSAKKAMINELLIQIHQREEVIKDIKMLYGEMK